METRGHPFVAMWKAGGLMRSLWQVGQLPGAVKRCRS